MKHLKSVENYNKKDIKIGDYALANIHGYRGMGSKEFMYFINNNIGRIIEIEDPKKIFDNVSIEYENVPYEIQHPWFRFDEETGKIFKRTRYGTIIVNSENKEDIEIALLSKKFNI